MKGTFRGIISDVTGVLSIIIAIGVFTIIMPLLLQLVAFMKSFQASFYQAKTQPQIQATSK